MPEEINTNNVMCILLVEIYSQFIFYNLDAFNYIIIYKGVTLSFLAFE
jgi:hypothetical protein